MKASLENLKVVDRFLNYIQNQKNENQAIVTLCLLDFPEEEGVYIISWNENKKQYVYIYQNLKGK